MSATGAAAARLAELRSVWRAILRCHRQKLPGPLRLLGDNYLGEEVRAHARSGKTTPEQWRIFEMEWRSYLTMLEGQADLQQQPQQGRDGGGAAAAAAAVVEAGPDRSGELPPDLLAAMSPAQREQLAKLRSAAESLARGGGGEGSGEGAGLDARPLG